MSKVLVTEGAGFIGSNLARLLLEEGREVTIYDDIVQLPLETSRHYRRPTSFRGRHMRGLAASVGNTRSIGHPIDNSDMNVIDPLRVLEAARTSLGCEPTVGMEEGLADVPDHDHQ